MKLAYNRSDCRTYRDSAGELHRECIECDKMFPMDSIHFSKLRDGYNSRCKACHGVMNARQHRKDPRVHRGSRQERLDDWAGTRAPETDEVLVERLLWTPGAPAPLPAKWKDHKLCWSCNKMMLEEAFGPQWAKAPTRECLECVRIDHERENGLQEEKNELAIKKAMLNDSYKAAGVPDRRILTRNNSHGWSWDPEMDKPRQVKKVTR